MCLKIATFSLFSQFQAKTLGIFQTIILKTVKALSPKAAFFTGGSYNIPASLSQELALGLRAFIGFDSLKNAHI